MAASLGGLVVSLGLDAAEFVTGLTKSQNEARRFARNVERDYNTIRSAIKAVAGAAAVNFAAQAYEGIAAYKDLSEQIGDTAANVAGLRLASDLSGRSLDEVAASSVRLTAALSKQDDESKGVAAALAAINLPIEEFRRLNPVGQLEAVANALANFEDDAGKAAVTVALFGRSGAQLLPFFNDLAEAGARNSRLTEDQIRATDEMTKEFARARNMFTQTAQVLLVDMVPALSETLKYFRESEAPLRVLEFAMKAVSVVLETLVILGANVSFVLGAVAREIAAIAAQVTALLSLDFNGFSAISDAVKRDGERARAELDAFERRVLRLDKPEGKDNWDLQGSGRARIDTSGLREGEKRATEAQRYLESLQKQALAAQDLSAEVTALFEIESGRLGKVAAAERDRILLAARAIDDIKRQKDETKQLEEIEKARIDQIKRSQAEAAAIYEATRTPAEALNIELDRLNRLLQDGYLSWDTYARAVLDAQDRFEKTTKDIKDQATEWDEFAKNAARGIQEHLGEGLYNIMTGNFENIGQSFQQMILRMVAEAQAAQLARYLLGDLVKGGEGGGIFGGILKDLGVSIFGGAKAGGGPVSAGGLYQVAENRPEMLDVNGRKFLMMGNQRGNIDPNPALGGGRGVMVTNNFMIQGNPGRQSQQQIASAAGMSINRAVRRMN